MLEAFCRSPCQAVRQELDLNRTSLRLLSLCGVIAPVLFAFVAVLGGALRPGYSHLSETVSELLSPGAPNKPLLDALYTLYAVLMTMFGIGMLWLVRQREQSTMVGTIGASLFVAMGLVSATTATIFPQDAWGSPPTFAGEMHKTLSAVVGLLSILSMLLIGIWSNRAGFWSRFGIYSFATIGASVLAAGFFVTEVGRPMMGLAERVSILVGFQWTFTLGLLMFRRTNRLRRPSAE
jgi:hypothetical protein